MKNSIKSIVVTLSIILVCGVLLAVLSDLLYVSDDERVNRAINKIYTSGEVTMSQEIDVSSVDMSDLKENGVIEKCYLLSNDEYLILSKGKKGYANGSITCYVAITKDLIIKQVVQNSYVGQTLMGKVASIYERYVGFSKNDDFGDFFSSDVLVAGVTKSSTAVSNSVYTALKFAERLGAL